MASIWPGRKPEDGEINLKGSVYDAEKLIRAVTHPYPGAFYYQMELNTLFGQLKLLKIKKKIKIIYFSFMMVLY